jgi:hypothetical protein
VIYFLHNLNIKGTCKFDSQFLYDMYNSNKMVTCKFVRIRGITRSIQE